MKKIIIMMIFALNTSISFAERSPFSERDMFYYGETPDAAAIAMGGSHVASMNTPFAAYWNPAAMAEVKNNSFVFSANVSVQSENDVELIKKSLPLEGRGINFVSISSPEVGVYYRRLSNRVDESEDDYLDGRVSVFGITVGVKHSASTNFGMNINYISGMAGYYDSEDVSPVISSGYGWGLDWGLIYKASPLINIGITLHNAPTYMYWEEWKTDRLPMLFRAGGELKLSRLMVFSVSYESSEFEDIRVKKGDILRFGIEQRIHESIVLRGGVYGRNKYFDDRYSLVYSAGVGYMHDSYGIDAALKRYYPDGSSSSLTDRYTVSGVIPF